MYLVNVILDVPLRCFSYVSEVTLTVGTRVLVEFGYKKMVGFVWQTNINKCDLECELSKIKPILTVFNEALAADVVALVKFVANYYHYPLGQTLFSGIPVGLRKPKPFALPQEVVLSLTDSARDGKLSFKGKKQRELYQRLLSHPLTPAEIKAIIGNSYGKLIATWQAEQIISAYPVKAVASNLVVHNKIQLNLEQQQIVAQVSQYFGQFHCGILYGITGSGKTEVYLELIEQIILRHQQALVLVPEINLTPQLLARFKHRFANVGMHILTSSASEKERVIGYLGAQDGSKQIIIGTRLAVFTPFKNLGIIIVDEEHDQSFKQNDGLRYNARDLAVWRANYAKVPILLGSATPSLESLYNYKLGRYALYKMTA
ncbi:MAG: DEAD/DEAH box helicase, partial [Burkholderiales bacterium]